MMSSLPVMMSQLIVTQITLIKILPNEVGLLYHTGYYIAGPWAL